MSNSDCLFCRIAAGAFGTPFLWEDDEVVAFLDIAPQAPTHALIIPRKHIASLGASTPEDDALLGKMLGVARTVAAQLGVAERGYRTVLNTGDDGGQSVHHLHVHVLGGRPMRWPPG